MKTKKLLVAYEPSKPTAKSKDFLLPQKFEGEMRFIGLGTGKYFEYGMMVMTGKEVTKNDLFAKLVDLGVKIDNVAETLDGIDNYIEQLGSYKISNVLKISSDDDSVACYRLEKTNLKTSKKKKSLP